ncbi:MAG: hypothetical protein BWY82_02316 [Verrucomicrobia bacterium ADurb.Bin474]|nr:MAG: hypothetical protein BWY82_02316 [Verrucomicrobia bacterium ADurb.Bin474]
MHVTVLHPEYASGIICLIGAHVDLVVSVPGTAARHLRVFQQQGPGALVRA